MKPASLLVISLLLSLATPALGEWQLVLSDRDRRIEIDRATVTPSDRGTKVAWGRVVLGPEQARQAGYTTVKALNRFDCMNRGFSTIKRVYLDDTDSVLREEAVTDQAPVLVTRNSVDERMWREVCRPPTTDDLAKTARDAGRSAADAQAKQAAQSKTKTKSPTPAPQTNGKTAQSAPAPATPVKTAPPQPVVVEKTPVPEKPAIERKMPEQPPVAAQPPAEKTPENKAQEERTTAAAPPMPPQTSQPRTSTPPAPPAKTAPPQTTRPQTPPQSPPQRQDAPSAAPAAPAAARTTSAAISLPAHTAWRYSGDAGPEHWGLLRPEWRLCAEGTRQSPIDLSDSVAVDLEPVKFDYRSSRFRVTDTGNTLRVDVGEGMGIELRGHRYELESFTLHRPSGTRTGGHSGDMSVQFLHRDAEGRMAILAVMLESGEPPSPLVQTVLNSLPLETGGHYMPAAPLDLAAFLPANPAHYLYTGSLPAPPCTEGVTWVVMKQPVPVSEEQLAVFSRLYPNSDRPPQPAHGRLVLESR